MEHLGEKITEYLVGEMAASEAAEATEHVRQCPDCYRQVEEFKHTLSLLQSVPDVEPPRPLVFEVERKSERWSWLWRFASPAAAAVAASIVTALLMSHPRVEPLSPGTQASVSQAWLAAELEKRDQAHDRDLQRLQSEVSYWESQQRAASRETFDTVRSIQLLAQRIP